MESRGQWMANQGSEAALPVTWLSCPPDLCMTQRPPEWQSDKSTNHSPHCKIRGHLAESLRLLSFPRKQEKIRNCHSSKDAENLPKWGDLGEQRGARQEQFKIGLRKGKA